MAMAPGLRAVDLHPRLVEKFWTTFATIRTDDPDECWRSSPTSHNAYAHVSVEVRSHRLRQLGHRVSFVLHHRDLAPGELVLHSCDTPVCWNPRHLTAGSHQDNSDDMKAKGRQPRGAHGAAAVNAARVVCIRGHAEWGRQKNGRYCRACERERGRRRLARKRAAAATGS